MRTMYRKIMWDSHIKLSLKIVCMLHTLDKWHTQLFFKNTHTPLFQAIIIYLHSKNKITLIPLNYLYFKTHNWYVLSNFVMIMTSPFHNIIVINIINNNDKNNYLFWS